MKKGILLAILSLIITIDIIIGICSLVVKLNNNYEIQKYYGLWDLVNSNKD